MIDALLSTNPLSYPQQPMGHIRHKAVAIPEQVVAASS